MSSLQRPDRRSWYFLPWLLYGLLLSALGVSVYAVGITLALLTCTLRYNPLVASADMTLVVSGLLVWFGGLLAALDLFVILPMNRGERRVEFSPPANTGLTVVLTAYNDELSIGLAVRDFLNHPLVRRVIVVDNNSRDGTGEGAAAAGATVVCERRPGYGECVYRALREGVNSTGTELTLLCEGDMTFRAYDIDKFMAYIGHADIVNGTRIVEQLRSRDTQLTTFMYYGNFFVGKLLEAKHIGKGTFTDVGTTYKLCRNEPLRRLLPLLNPSINLEFNAHFLDTALQHQFRLLECPVSFHNRVGVSKGGNVSDRRALKVGLRMIVGIVFGWKRGT